jgi:hypothetical protein
VKKKNIAENATRLTTSIVIAADKPRIDDITITSLADSEDSLVELWSEGYVVGQFLMPYGVNRFRVSSQRRVSILDQE